MQNSRLVFVAMLLAVFVTRFAVAESTPALSGKAEAAAMEFAKTHHPELASLLEQLKTNAPSEYRSAMIELDKARERLEKSREKTPDRADLELAEWKVNSRIRLLAARMTMGGEPSLEADLKAALRERIDLRAQLLADERDRLRRRLEKLDETIAEQKRRADDQVEKEFAGLKRGTPAAVAPATKKNGKPNKPTESSDAKPTAKQDKLTGEKPVEKKPSERKPEAKSPTGKPEKSGSEKSSEKKPAENKPAKS